jgi:hypothetical protein
MCIIGTPKRTLDGLVPVQARRYEDSPEDVDETELPCEPAGHGAIATGNVKSCKELCRASV